MLMSDVGLLSRCFRRCVEEECSAATAASTLTLAPRTTRNSHPSKSRWLSGSSRSKVTWWCLGSRTIESHTRPSAALGPSNHLKKGATIEKKDAAQAFFFISKLGSPQQIVQLRIRGIGNRKAAVGPDRARRELEAPSNRVGRDQSKILVVAALRMSPVRLWSLDYWRKQQSSFVRKITAIFFA